VARQNQVTALRSRIVELEAELDAAHAALEVTPNLPVPVATGSQLVVWRRR